MWKIVTSAQQSYDLNVAYQRFIHDSFTDCVSASIVSISIFMLHKIGRDHVARGSSGMKWPCTCNDNHAHQCH